MRPSLALDPALIAIPGMCDTEEKIIDAVNALTAIASDLRNNSDCDFYIIPDAATYLSEAGMFPISSSISEMLTTFNLRHVYTPEDIRRAANDILSKAHDIEILSGVEFMIPTSVTTSTGVTEERDGPLREALELTLAHTLFAADEIDPQLVRVVIANTYENTEIKVTASIDNIEPPRPPDGVTSVVGMTLDLLATPNCESFLKCCSPETIWRHSSNGSEIGIAIKVAAQNIRLSAGCPNPSSNCHPFEVGNSFFQSLQDWEGSADGKNSGSMLDTSARLVARMPKYEVGNLTKNTGAKGKEEIVIRESDKAEACRTHITKHHEGMRLLFWQLKDGTLELANVGAKAELKIM